MTSIAEILPLHQQLPGDNPRYDLELLLCELLDCQPAYLRTWPEKQLSAEQEVRLQQWIGRRVNGEPIAHLIGRQAFWTLDLLVTPDTLIPRQDTELLIERVLQLPISDSAKVLDMGTGTGAIALALATERQHWQVLASDFKPSVVALAKKNAERHQLSNVEIFQSDWFTNITVKTFDLIVSNPPYIAPDDAHLCQGDLRFEASSALVAEDMGLADIRHIVSQAPNYLNDQGWLVLEHGYDQGASVQSLLVQYGFDLVECCQDLGGNDRVSLGQYRRGQ